MTFVLSPLRSECWRKVRESFFEQKFLWNPQQRSHRENFRFDKNRNIDDLKLSQNCKLPNFEFAPISPNRSFLIRRAVVDEWRWTSDPRVLDWSCLLPIDVKDTERFFWLWVALKCSKRFWTIQEFYTWLEGQLNRIQYSEKPGRFGKTPLEVLKTAPKLFQGVPNTSLLLF